MNKKMLMKCGHVSNAVTHDGKHVCVICNCKEVSKNDIILKERKARCCMCGRITESKETLPFFKYTPNKEFDEYYCGCGGWD